MKRKKILTLFLLFICLLSFGTTTQAAKISKKKVTTTIGKTITLKITGTKKAPKWTSSNKAIASVTSKGKVYAKRPGTVTIKATIGKKKYTCALTIKAPNPKCFPEKTLKIGDVTINSFSAKYVSFKVYEDYSKNIAANDLTYFFPYTYRLKISGQAPIKNGLVTLRFCLMRNGAFPPIPANNYIQVRTDENGNFTYDKNTKFSTYGEMIYIASADYFNV